MSTDTRRDLAVRWLACFALLWTPFLVFSSLRGDPLPGVALLQSVGIFGALAGLAALLAGRRRGARRVFVFTLLVALFLDLRVPAFDGGIALAGTIVVAAIAWSIRDHLALVAAVTFGTVLVSSILIRPTQGDFDVVALPPDGSRERSPSAPGRLVHLILDEFASPSGIPTDVEGGPKLRAELETFFRAHDFVLDRNSISEFAASRASISGILNFSASPTPQSLVRGKRPYVLRRNAYFEWLHGRGHSIDVYQSTYMDFCEESPVPLSSCFTYRFDGSDWLETSSLGPSDKLSALLGLYLNQPGFFESAWKGFVGLRTGALGVGIALPEPMAWDGVPAPIVARSVLDRLRDHVEHAPEGSAVFAHLLLPHGPYVYDADCGLRPHPLRWLGSRPLHRRDNDAAGRERRYRQYFAQVRCTLRELDALFEGLKRAGRWADTEIVLHGDHGARIYETAPRARNRDRLTSQDLADAFATLLAIRSPRFERGAEEGPRTVSHRLAAFAGVDMGTPPAEEPPIVYLEDQDDAPWVAMPYRAPERASDSAASPAQDRTETPPRPLGPSGLSAPRY